MSSVSGDDPITPQQVLDEFWENLITKKPGKVTNIFPPSLYANLLQAPQKPGTVHGRNATASYEEAAAECRARVKRIMRECQRTNEKYTDPDFDIENDPEGNCLYGLMDSYTPPETVTVDDGSTTTNSSSIPTGDIRPPAIHRVDWIYDDPHFTVDGFDSSDVQQGQNGDCWFIAALATICSNPSLMHKVCVARDEECGVYGFVFYRDGDWIWTVIDDNLYLNSPDFAALGDSWDPTGKAERKWKKNHQTGSDALYYASCADQNETWLPLLEKAYAKVHGDYASIEGGFAGEAVEDLTGGVTSKVLTNRVLSKDRLWKELVEVNRQFLFAASTPGTYGDDTHVRKGLALGHAYSVIKAVEEEDEDGKKHRLVQIRNPWGRIEWNGSWSDGAKEWNPYWMKKLNYQFGDDGVFWMSFEDLQKRFDLLDRTRLFDKTWTSVQLWTSAPVAWVTGYLNTKFSVEIKKAGPTVFVLSQLDERYFKGLEGKYSFDLHFLLQEPGAAQGDHIVRARGAWFGNRSISAEVDLEPGIYEVVPKIVANKCDIPDVLDVVKQLADKNPQKLRQIGMNYDIANAKGGVALSEEEKKKKEQKKKEATEKKRKEKEDAEKEKVEFETWKLEKKEREEKEKAAKAKEGDKDGEEKEEEKKEKNKDEKKDDAKTEEPKTTTDEKAEETKEAEKTEAPKTEVPTIEEPKNTEDAPGPKAAYTPSVTASEAQYPQAPPYQGYGYGRGPSSVYGDAEAPAPVPAPVPVPPPVVEKQNPWSAVCVLGLRVYSKDPEVTIKLVQPKDAEEGAVLDTDGATQAGATM